MVTSHVSLVKRVPGPPEAVFVHVRSAQAGAPPGRGSARGAPHNESVTHATEPRRRADSSPYVNLSRSQWSALRESTPLPLTAEEVERLRGLGDVVDLREVRDIYLPLSRLLNLYVAASHKRREALNSFLTPTSRGDQPGTPFVIGIAGSVAVGKSTTARLLKALLARRPEHPRVELVATDGFLLSKEELERRGLMSRKGFPESYDRRALTRFVADVKSGKEEVRAPVYSHLTYDTVPGEWQVVRRPDIVIIEGLTILQPPMPGRDGLHRTMLADYLDFSIYVDAATDDIARWYLSRFRQLRETAFRNPRSHFHRYTQVSEEEAMEYGRHLWRTINLPNLRDNVRPTRGRATLVLHKARDHTIQRVSLRRP